MQPWKQTNTESQKSNGDVSDIRCIFTCDIFLKQLLIMNGNVKCISILRSVMTFFKCRFSFLMLLQVFFAAYSFFSLDSTLKVCFCRVCSCTAFCNNQQLTGPVITLGCCCFSADTAAVADAGSQILLSVLTRNQMKRTKERNQTLSCWGTLWDITAR